MVPDTTGGVLSSVDLGIPERGPREGCTALRGGKGRCKAGVLPLG